MDTPIFEEVLAELAVRRGVPPELWDLPTARYFVLPPEMFKTWPPVTSAGVSGPSLFRPAEVARASRGYAA